MQEEQPVFWWIIREFLLEERTQESGLGLKCQFATQTGKKRPLSPLKIHLPLAVKRCFQKYQLSRPTRAVFLRVLVLSLQIFGNRRSRDRDSRLRHWRRTDNMLRALLSGTKKFQLFIQGSAIGEGDFQLIASRFDGADDLLSVLIHAELA